jgi:hypothetical protein
MACDRAEYVGHVDGDDYVHAGKLTEQVRLLDEHPEVALSAHAVEVVGQGRVFGADSELPEWGGLDQLLLRGTYFTNSSTMYRSVNRFEHDIGVDIIDFYSHVEQASRGLIHLNKNILGAYRWNSGGVSKSEVHRKRIEAGYEKAFDRALALGSPAAIVKRGRLTRRKAFALAQLVSGDLTGFRRRITLKGGDWLYASWIHRALSMFRFGVRGFAVKFLVARINK